MVTELLDKADKVVANTSGLADAAQRSQALDPTQSYIVQAPAGSGKTALLTRRVLNLLAIVDEPEEILAITFTRKAAAEMRARVVEALQEGLQPQAPSSAFAAESYVLAQAVLARDKARDWQLLENPERLRMSTIDSLCSMLAQQLPVTSTLGGAASPVDDASGLYREAARRRLKHHTENFSELLRTVGNRFDQAERLLAAMLAKRVREWLEAQLSTLVSKNLNHFDARIQSTGVANILRQDAFSLLQTSTTRLAGLDELTSGRAEQRAAFQSLSAMPDLQAAHLAAWQALLGCLFTGAGKSLRKKVTRTDGFPTSAKDCAALGVTPAEAKAQRDAIVDVLNALREAPGVEEAMQSVLALPQPNYADNQWALLDELTRELPQLETTLYQVFVENGAVDFIEISTRARYALGDEDAPTDLALAMDLRLQHLLVDEFQDTSRSQFALFQQLVAGWQKGDGRTFFAVGDPMQNANGKFSFIPRCSELGKSNL